MLYKQYGKFDVSKLKTITSMDAVMKYHIWEQEACQRLCIEQSMARGKYRFPARKASNQIGIAFKIEILIVLSISY